MRKVAILVASLDEELSERMLAEMPAADARAVRLAIETLGDVETGEQDEIVEQFRTGTAQAPATHTEGVELDASLLARIEQQDSFASAPLAHKQQHTLASLTHAETTTIVEALSHEHPQTVAVVLSRLDHVVAAEILSQLAPHLQVDVLARLSELDPADEQSLHVVESHLAQWIDQQRQRKQRQTAGAELVQRILENTPADRRAAILTRLNSKVPEFAERLGNRYPTSPSHPRQADRDIAQSKLSVFPPVPNGIREDRLTRGSPIKTFALPPQPRPSAPKVESHVEDPLSVLEQATDAALMHAMTQADKQVVTLALAGASDQLMNRILQHLPRRQAKQLRRQLREIGPTRLSDMLAAQQQLAGHVAGLSSR